MKVGEFRSISLVTSLYKIISMVLAERPKVLPFNLHDVESAFIDGRQILDAILIASETVGEWEALNKSGFILKLDYKKVYDKLDWMYLDAIMYKKGFGLGWRH